MVQCTAENFGDSAHDKVKNNWNGHDEIFN